MFYLTVLVMCKCTLYSISTKPNSMHSDIIPWIKWQMSQQMKQMKYQTLTALVEDLWTLSPNFNWVLKSLYFLDCLCYKSWLFLPLVVCHYLCNFNITACEPLYDPVTSNHCKSLIEFFVYIWVILLIIKRVGFFHWPFPTAIIKKYMYRTIIPKLSSMKNTPPNKHQMDNNILK